MLMEKCESKFYGQLRLVSSVLRESQFVVLKLIDCFVCFFFGGGGWWLLHHPFLLTLVLALLGHHFPTFETA